MPGDGTEASAITKLAGAVIWNEPICWVEASFVTVNAKETVPPAGGADGETVTAKHLPADEAQEDFDPIIISGDHGYRKPDRRLFQLALDGMGVAAANALYVGNDMFRDIYGAREAGLATVMFNSDQGAKAYRDCVPDYTISDFRDLLQILGLPMP